MVILALSSPLPKTKLIIGSMGCMSQCCCSPSPSNNTSFTCPQGHHRGKPVQLITLKSLLKPSALERLDPQSDYRFCDTPECPVVYFSNQGAPFTTQDLKVPVFQKDEGEEIYVCYCFGWSRRRLQNELASTDPSTIIKIITDHIKVKRCGCEVNNPQGSCCLNNVKRVIQKIQRSCAN